MKELASEIEMLGIRDDGTRYVAKLVPYSLIRIHDPARGRTGASQHNGELWAWADGGRPIAVAEIWRWNRSRDRWGHALVSTTPGRVMAEVDDQTWCPEGPGLKFHQLNQAGSPSAVRERRAQQARDLASKFSGFEVYRDRRIDLELLPEPIYRYESDNVSGSVFSLAHYDNPEALLFIESVGDPVAPAKWRYAVAQVSSHELHVEYQGQEAVVIPEADNYVGSPTDPFWVLYVEKTLEVTGQRPVESARPTDAPPQGDTADPENESDPAAVKDESEAGIPPEPVRTSMKNLKALGLAMHNYHIAQGSFPPAVLTGPNGVSHSWRVALLPHLGLTDLYGSYRRDEPWDSEHNRKLLKRMPDIYRSPLADEESVNASYFVLTGKGAPFGGEQGLSYRDFVDGTSATALIIEAKRDIPWTKPTDIRYDPSKSVPSFGDWHEDGFLFAMADGSVHFVPEQVEDETLHRLFRHADGELFRIDELRADKADREGQDEE